MAELPIPMTPADCDLRGLDYMPLFGNHLFGSEFNAAASDTEWRAAVTLWWAAWNQVPAGSLPDDDIALCRLADLGRDVKTWKKLRARALHGFVKCRDSRLYHEFLCEQAAIAWDKRCKERERKAKWRADKDAARQGHAQHVPGTGTGTETGTSTSQNADVPADGNGRDGTGRDVDLGKSRGSSPTPSGDGLPLLPGIDPDQQPGIPPCDHQAVLALWREHLPTSPQPAKWTETRRKHLQARWRELFADGKAHNRDEALAWFAKFFRYLAKSKFLTGRVTPREPGRPPFFAELPWVLEPENFVQCIEGKYHPET